MDIEERVSQLAENYTHLMGGLCDCEDKIQALEERLVEFEHSVANLVRWVNANEDKIRALAGGSPILDIEEDKDSLARLILTPHTTKSNSHFIMPEER